MVNKIFIILTLVLVIVLPFAFTKKERALHLDAEERLVIITPHNEAVRYEFSQAFKKWYRKKTGKAINIDWRVLGGTQEVIRYINSQFENSFQYHWEKGLGRNWNDQISDVFIDSKITLPDNEEDDNEQQSIRRTFLESSISCGIDLLFGGGELEVKEQASRGQLVDSGILQRRPEWFKENVIPQKFAGVDFYDPNGLWVGATHSGFGIIYNRDVLKNIKYNQEPTKWVDLADPAFFGEVALADPTVSSSSNRAFEMILQQLMQAEFSRTRNPEVSIEHGWNQSMQVIQLIAANARYFTDSSTKPVLDVSSGDCAVGMSIDFYGLFQEENLKNRSDSVRFGFTSPKGGSVPTADSIAMLRGAPNSEAALDFIEFVVSPEGQKIWAFKVGVPGGPLRYSLRRPPVRKDLYKKEYYAYRSNPELNIYRDIGDFKYRPSWTVPMFNVLRFSIKSAFVDPHVELSSAWKAIINAEQEGRLDDAQNARSILQDLDLLQYDNASTTIKDTLESGDPLKVIRLQSRLSENFVKNYRKAKALAQGAS